MSLALASPYCEYLDGDLAPKSLPDEKHSALLYELMLLPGARASEYGLRIRPELHLRITETRYRIPDLAVFSAGSEVPLTLMNNLSS
ncbi:MAG: hypothetical protein H7039_18235 [Bryobacteraceae bacterium]|nr:hypothetical protein [Bryobacteraceae bacterium]